MRTNALTTLALLLATAAPAVVHAQPVRPHGLTEREYQAKKRELRADLGRLMAEHARYADGASGFQGVWTVSGTRSFQRNETSGAALEDFEGEITMNVAEGAVTVEGSVRLVGRRSGKWEGAGPLSSDGTRIESDYRSTIGGDGQVTYSLEADGTVRVSWASAEQINGRPKARGDGRLVRAIPGTQADLELELFKVNHELQFLRYFRPEPSRYASRNEDVTLRFTPTVEFDPDGVEQQVLDLIASAQKSLDLCLFECSLPRVSKALIEAQARGVRVRVVYDNREDEQPAVHMLRDAGVPIISDGRSGYMHNKFIVVDEALVWTGSTNIAPRGIYVSDNHALTLRNEALAGIYTTEFEEMFLDGAFGVTSPQNTSNDWVRVDRYTKVQVYFAPEDNAMDRVIEVVRGAEKSIKFIAFAFTSEALFDAMKARMQDGVEVEGIFESRHAGWKDIKIGPLNAAGATVRFDRNPDALHHKVIVVDDRYVCTGSFNFSDSADRSNDENMLVIDSRPLARTFVEEFEKLMSVTDATDPRIATAGMPDADVASADDLDPADSDGIVGELDE